MEKLGGGYNKEELREQIDNHKKDYHVFKNQYFWERVENGEVTVGEVVWKVIKPFTPVIGLVTVFTALTVVPATIIHVSENNAEKNDQTVNYYEQQKYLGDENQSFYRDMKSYDQQVEKLKTYIDVSNELHKLGVSNYDDITCFDDAVIFQEPVKVYAKIDEYRNLSKKIHVDNGNRIIGDDVVVINHLAYELKELEKMYNQKIYDGYEVLEEYGKASVKSYLSDIYGGDPDQYKLHFNDYQHDGYKEIDGPGIHYGDAIDSDIYDYLDVINKVYKADNATDEPHPEEYNKDRNKVMMEVIEQYNTEGADIIKDIERHNSK